TASTREPLFWTKSLRRGTWPTNFICIPGGTMRATSRRTCRRRWNFIRACLRGRGNQRRSSPFPEPRISITARHARLTTGRSQRPFISNRLTQALVFRNLTSIQPDRASEGLRTHTKDTDGGVHGVCTKVAHRFGCLPAARFGPQIWSRLCDESLGRGRYGYRNVLCGLRWRRQ